MKKVSATTITQLTARAAVGPLSSLSNALVTPDAADLIAQLEQDAPQAARELQDLQKQMPEGFALAPVLYTRIPAERRASIESEYLFSVRQRFLKFLANTQADALKRLGVCEHGIARMARGLDPANKDGRYYDLSVDHIIERAGSGRLSDERRPDPQRRDEVQVWPVNHFGNLMLMPKEVHDFKNRLNGLQGMHKMQDGESRWILMMVPVRSQRDHGYVCPPQAQAVRHYPPNAAQQMKETGTLAAEAAQLFEELQRDAAMNKTLHLLEALAGKKRAANANDRLQPVGAPPRNIAGATPPKKKQDGWRRTDHVADIAAGPRGRGLCAVFNAVAADDPALGQRITRELRPAIDDFRRMLLTTHARIAKVAQTDPQAAGFWNQYTQFFRGRSLRRVVEEAARWPLPESQALLADYRRLDREINRHRPPKPQNPYKKAA